MAKKKTTTGTAAKAGRPKGAKTADRPVVDCTPSPCPHCGATAAPVDKKNRKRIERRVEGSGRLPDGRAFGAVVFWAANCGACGQPITAKRHEFVP